MLEEIERTGISDIEADLDAEMKKNAEERDLKKIKMLIELILKMKGEDEDVLNEELHKALIFENVTAQKKTALNHNKTPANVNLFRLFKEGRPVKTKILPNLL
jgi:hypothetical protein